MKATSLIQPSIDATVAFLRKLSFKEWLILGVINFFSGGGMSGGGSGGGGSGGGTPSGEMPDFSALLAKYWWVIAGLGLIGVILAVLFTLLSWLFRFVLYDVVSSKKVRIRLWQKKESAYRMFWFSVAMLLLGIIILALLGIVVLLAIQSGLPGILLTIMAVLFVILLFLLLALVGLFVDAFVVPDQFFHDRTFGESVRRMWKTFRAQTGECVVFVIARAVLSLVFGVFAAIVAAFAGVTLGVVLLLAAVPFGALGLAVPSLGTPLLVAGALLSIPVMLAFGLLASTITSPVSVFATEYTIAFYKKVLTKN